MSQIFVWNSERRKHLPKCQLKARTALMADGMTEEEALLAVEPPLKVTIDESVDEVDENDDGRNPFKLKRCTIPIQKVSYIERAVK